MFYLTPPPAFADLEQGDLLENVPFSYFNLAQAVAVGADNKSATRDLSSAPRDAKFVVASLTYSWGIVLTQSCDLEPDSKTGQHEGPITIARVRPVAEVVPAFDESTPKKALSSVNNLSTEAKAPNVFYLPPFSSETLTLPRMGVYLLDVQRFGGSSMTALRSLARLRLSVSAQQAFQSRTSYCFGRFAAPENFFLSPDDLAEKERQEQEKRRNQPK